MSLRRRAPAFHVLDAFGVARGSLEPLGGGSAYTWRADDLVLKAGVEPRFVSWLDEVARRVEGAGAIRWASPVPALDGRLVVGGWSATRWQKGAHRPGDTAALLAASGALHLVLAAAAIEWPAFLRGRTDRWAVADRVAWGEEAVPRFRGRSIVEVLELLAPLLHRPWCGPAPQLVHGDLTGNVLFDEDGELPPAVIDLSPYHRPAGLADAVVVADAVAWHGAPLSSAADFAAGSATGRDLLARAVVFRVIAAPDHVEAYRPIAALAAEG